nr:hypothetical protein [Kocuria indica]
MSTPQTQEGHGLHAARAGEHGGRGGREYGDAEGHVEGDEFGHGAGRLGSAVPGALGSSAVRAEPHFAHRGGGAGAVKGASDVVLRGPSAVRACAETDAEPRMSTHAIASNAALDQLPRYTAAPTMMSPGPRLSALVSACS